MLTGTSITFTDQPLDGDILMVAGNIFEFNNTGSVEANHIPVTIGSTVTETRANFETAVGGV